MVLGHAPGNVIELDFHRVALAGNKGGWGFAAVAHAQVLQVIGDAGHFTTGPHVIQANRHGRDRLIHREFNFNLGLAHDIHGGLKGGRIEGDGLRIIIFLVAGKFGAEPDDAVFAAIAAGGLPRRNRQRLFRSGIS